MPLIVTPLLYSGRANPSWVVPDDRAGDLARQHNFESGGPDRVQARLGYRGMRLRHTAPGGGGLASRNALSDAARGGLVASEPELERALLDLAGDRLSDAARSHILSRIESGSAGDATEPQADYVGCPQNHGQGAPAYQPQLWNDNNGIQDNNNCYNYANNQQTNTFAQPGRGTGQEWTDETCDNVGAAATRDGLAAVANVNADIAGWYVALVIWPNEDYHWYRQDQDGCWSHKAGETEATNLDDAGNQITDPQTADRGDYTTWCTYMTTNANVTIL